jgi:hypothetical protein
LERYFARGREVDNIEACIDVGLHVSNYEDKKMKGREKCVGNYK